MKKISLQLLALLSIVACTQDPSSSVQPINPTLNFQPNILWLVAEDLSPVIPVYGDSTIVTPTLNRLAAEGVAYDHFFSPAPVCAPARSAIITGMYPNHIGTTHMRTGPWASGNVTPQTIANSVQYWPEGVQPYEAVPAPEVKMFTEFLRSAGYYCTNHSKEDYQFRKTMTAWDESGNNAHWRNREPGQPFFSVFNFEVCHESRIWSKANDSLWVDANLDVPVPPYLPDTEVGRTDIRRMYSNILEMDYQVGLVLDQLEKDGLLDSTIVFWYSDHGGPLPRQKRALHDSGLKVPMVIRFPKGLFAGERDDRMISFIDLAPTILSLAGLVPPSYMDGKAFLGEHMRQEEPQYIFAAADRFDAEYDHNRAARDNRYKYIRYYDQDKPMFLHSAYRDQMPIMRELYKLRDSSQLTEAQALWFRPTKPQEELFDTWSDPHEINNLAGIRAYESKLAELKDALEHWVTSIHDTGLIPEEELLERFVPGGVQQQTVDPVIKMREGNLVLTTITTGASIGYKLVGPGESDAAMAWEIYNDPIEIPKGQHFIVKAHRIGFVPSNEVSIAY